MENIIYTDLETLDELNPPEEEPNISISRHSFNSFRIERSIRDLLNWEKRDKVGDIMLRPTAFKVRMDSLLFASGTNLVLQPNFALQFIRNMYNIGN